jgi:hypothetical protein
MREKGMTDGSRLALVVAFSFYISNYVLALYQKSAAMLSPRPTVNLPVRVVWQVSATRLISEENNHE